ncbi:MAG: thymidine phosphorylase [Chloroflexota bacterium]|nr:MAG: thymidine phosphorylase [Chloroflexota bacterium]
MAVVDLLARKRDGGQLTGEEISYLIRGYHDGRVLDSQMAALLMAINWRGLSRSETSFLTQALVDSGRALDLRPVVPMAADKHSTGGVSDKTTLVVAPLVAACGLPVAKMAGRGLSFTGGTLDKLESFPGLRVELTESEFLHTLERVGLVIGGQSPDLAPAEGKLYALRNLTATVPNIGLIASSIMAKKLAAGAQVIVLDVKAGSGAFCKTESEAVDLARLMVEIGQSAGRQVAATISRMDQPLGRAVGNTLEVQEAIATLRGHGPEDVLELSLHLASQMILLSGLYADQAAASARLQRALEDSTALDKLAQMVEVQGGRSADVYHPENLASAPYVETLRAQRAGYVTAVDALKVGVACLTLGAGRTKKDQSIDHAAGIVLHAKRGSYVGVSDALAEIHCSDDRKLGRARELLEDAFAWGEEPPGEIALIASATVL